MFRIVSDWKTVWGKDFPYWNPVSFYEHLGYSRVDQIDNDILVWKPFTDNANPPRMLRQKNRPIAEENKVSVVSLFTGWCGGCVFNLMAREAVDGLEDIVDFMEVDTSVREKLLVWGVSDGILLEGEPYRSDGPPFSVEELRQEILGLSRKKTSEKEK